MLLRKTLLEGCKNIKKCLSTLPLQNIDNTSPEDPRPASSKLDILQHPDYFNVADMFTIKDLFDARVHLGHKKTSLNENMKPYLFGSRMNHLIFDLNITANCLQKALNFAAHVAYKDGVILFVSRNSQHTLMVERTAAECKEFAITREWKLGCFTASDKVFGYLVRLPDLCIVLNTLEENGFEHPVVKEAAKMLIPTIAIVDSNSNPNLVTYPVPGNDDSYVSIKLYCELFKKAILKGKSERLKHESSTNQDKTTATK
ncbi:hypothetical protein RUM43_011056 [Polyplax serrata]|uniref:Small ribosomal subunit protein uS2m n=1 Tax=Polyplax serrata TaxID=468196 RepID=A0AAN8S7P1_POLSC